MATSSPGFWFGVSTLLQAGVEPPTSLFVLTERHWEDCLRSCDDPVVLGRVLHAAFAGKEPSREVLSSLASQLINRSLRLETRGPALLELLQPFIQQQPGLLLFMARTIDNAAHELCCSGVIRSPQQHQELKARQIELLGSLMENPSAAVRLLAEKLAGLDTVDIVFVAACGLYEAFFMHLEAAGAEELEVIRCSFAQGLTCAVPGIQLPATQGACRLLLHGRDSPDAQDTMRWLLLQLVQALCGLEGQFGLVDWAAAVNDYDTIANLASPHDFGPFQLMHLLKGVFCRLASSQPQRLLQTLCGTVCDAADRGILQVDVATGCITNNDLAIQDVLRLKAQCSLLKRALLQCSSSGGVAAQVSEGGICAAISDQLVTVNPKAVRAWLL
ncbi:hypothetical protein N2152v2_000942 [Parachlorella kessleri]